jgi:hypothetical protein
VAARVKEYLINPDKIYKLTKLHPDGKQEFKGMGHSSNVAVGVGVVCANWYTTTVQDIIKTGKGCIFETLNSTYLLEEVDKLDDEAS